MRTTFPLVPIAVAAPARAFAAVSAVLANFAKALVRARRNRAEAVILAHLDGHMLADMGITRADVQDAFSEPFWEDPTALLRERAIERRLGRPLRVIQAQASQEQAAFKPLPLARQAI